MYLADILAGLGRRWWAVVLGVLATAGLAVAAFVLVPTSYTAQASMLLLPPGDTPDGATNPFLDLGGLQPASDVLARALSDGTVHDTIAPPNGPATFTVDRDTTSSGPLVLIQVKDSTPTAAMQILDAVVTQTPKTLDALQNDLSVKAQSRIQIVEVVRSDVPNADSKSQLRAILVAVAGGLAATLFGTKLLDSFLLRRSAARQQRDGAPSKPQEEDALAFLDDVPDKDEPREALRVPVGRVPTTSARATHTQVEPTEPMSDPAVAEDLAEPAGKSGR